MGKKKKENENEYRVKAAYVIIAFVTSMQKTLRAKESFCCDKKKIICSLSGVSKPPQTPR